MDGMDLYLMYQQALARQGVETDDWETLDDRDRNAWRDVAEQVEPIAAE